MFSGGSTDAARDRAVAQTGDSVDIDALVPALDVPDTDAYLFGDVRLPHAMFCTRAIQALPDRTSRWWPCGPGG